MFKVQAKGKDSAEILLYDSIGQGGVEAKDFVNELKALKKVKCLDLRLNSEGGSVFEGTTIYNQLKQFDAKITVYVDGLAASVASLIAMAGDEIVMGDGAYVMIHDPWTVAMGNAAELQKTVNLLANLGDSFAETYAKKTGCSKAEIRKMMEAETWMNAATSVAKGFASRVSEDKVSAAIRDPAKYRSVPKNLLPRPAFVAAQRRLAAVSN